MGLQTLDLNYKFTTLNDYIKAERTPKWGQQMANTIKKRETNFVNLKARKLLSKIDSPVRIIFNWRCSNRKSDPDNIAFAKKFILDGLVKASILANDGWKQIKGFEDNFEKSDEDGVEINLIEVRQ